VSLPGTLHNVAIAKFRTGEGDTLRLSEQEYESLVKRNAAKDPYHVTVVDRATGKELPQPKVDPLAVHGITQKSSKKTRAEQEAENMLAMEFRGCAVKFHGLAIYLDCGHRYTPDYIVQLPEGKILVVEVKQEGKNGFRQQSYRSARLAFDQSRVEWSMFRFRWMEKKSSGWEIKDYP
jgi:hypothetical protein